MRAGCRRSVARFESVPELPCSLNLVAMQVNQCAAAHFIHVRAERQRMLEAAAYYYAEGDAH